MIEKDSKILVHFDTNDTSIYQLKGDSISLIKKERVFFNETLIHDELFKKIDYFIEKLRMIVEKVDNESVRLYATGVFQEFSEEEQTQLIIHVFVNSGLCFNIVKPDLEQFYIEKGLEKSNEKNIINGIVQQEFRKVVICGSFQQNMQEIGNIIEILNKRNIQILSPWTMDIVQESLGTDFILLEGQELVNERDAWRHKYDHMNKFKKADAIIVCNPEGRIGKGTMFEFGFMVAYSKRIIFTNEPKELSIPFPYEIGLNFM